MFSLWQGKSARTVWEFWYLLKKVSSTYPLLPENMIGQNI